MTSQLVVVHCPPRHHHHTQIVALKSNGIHYPPPICPQPTIRPSTYALHLHPSSTCGPRQINLPSRPGGSHHNLLHRPSIYQESTTPILSPRGGGWVAQPQQTDQAALSVGPGNRGSAAAANAKCPGRRPRTRRPLPMRRRDRPGRRRAGSRSSSHPFERLKRQNPMHRHEGGGGRAGHGCPCGRPFQELFSVSSRKNCKQC